MPLQEIIKRLGEIVSLPEGAERQGRLEALAKTDAPLQIVGILAKAGITP